MIPPEEPDETCTWTEDPGDANYFIRSTVMGGEVIAETGFGGYGGKRMVLVGGEVAAYLTYRPGGDAVHFRQTDALGISERVTRAYPEDLFGVTTSEPSYIDPRHVEREPSGGNVGTKTSYQPVFYPVNTHFPPIEDDSPVYINGTRVSFSMDGVSMSTQVAMAYINTAYIGGINGLNRIIMRQNDPQFAGWSSNGRWFGSNAFAAGTEAIESNTWQAQANYFVGNTSLTGVNWTQQQTSVELPANFRDQILQRIKSTQAGQTMSCNDFITKILEKATSNYRTEQAEIYNRAELAGQKNSPFQEYTPDARTGRELAEKISQFTLVDNLNLNGHGAGGTVQGSIREGNAEVLIAKKFYRTPIVRGTDPVRMWTNWYVGTAIHEMIHLAGRIYTDGALAKAAYDLGYNPNKVANPNTNDVNEIFKYSGDWQDTIAKYCGRR